MKNKKRILITGASGTVGSALLDQILDYESLYDITVFDMDNKHSRRIFKKYAGRIHCQYGDITDPLAVEKVCIEKDAVIHLAAIIPPLADKNTSLAYRVNVLGTRNLIEGLETYSPGAFFLFASSISVYGDRIIDPEIKVGDPLQASEGDYYAQTKIEAEAIVRNSKLDWSIFRLTMISGAKNHKISPIMFHVPLETRLEIVTPEDTARAFLHALEKKPDLLCKTFNLGGGERCRISYRDFLKKSFTLYGLGKLNFPNNAFAKRNFHCGYYLDGDVLEAILNFRRDNLDSYFQRVNMSISGIQRSATKFFRIGIKRTLLNKSDPRKAVKKKDPNLIRRFFGDSLKPANG
jgi:nucleoside-diphosphate-sugar epimerase